MSILAQLAGKNGLYVRTNKADHIAASVGLLRYARFRCLLLSLQSAVGVADYTKTRGTP
jgi:hypothetical protein